MTDILYTVDDADIVHWKLYDPGDRHSANEVRDWADNVKLNGWPVYTFLRDADEETLEGLGNYLFDRFHSSNSALTDYLLKRFDYDVDDFIDYLEENFNRESLRNIRDSLTSILER
ncbi:MAG TPA: hypothetical protein VGK13_07795 [Methanocellaceae archaeon]